MSTGHWGGLRRKVVLSGSCLLAWAVCHLGAGSIRRVTVLIEEIIWVNLEREGTLGIKSVCAFKVANLILLQDPHILSGKSQQNPYNADNQTLSVWIVCTCTHAHTHTHQLLVFPQINDDVKWNNFPQFSANSFMLKHSTQQNDGAHQYLSVLLSVCVFSQ